MTPRGEVLIVPLATGTLESGDDLPRRLQAAWEESGTDPAEGDVLIVASKAVATWEGRIVALDRVDVSPLAEELALGTGLPAAFCQVVLDESDHVLGGVPGALLTLSRGILVANGGADLSNVPAGHAVLWPEDAWAAARTLRDAIAAMGHAGVGVVVVDSHVQPLRYGTVGMALGWAGLRGVEDVRGHRDLFGKELHVTRRNVADMLASAGTLVMGEADEATPAVLVRGLDVGTPSEGEQGPHDVLVEPGQCLFTPVYMGALLDDGWDDEGRDEGG